MDTESSISTPQGKQILEYFDSLKRFLQKDHKAFFLLKHVKPELFEEYQTGNDFEGIGGGNFVMGLAGLSFLEGISNTIVRLAPLDIQKAWLNQYITEWKKVANNATLPEEKEPKQLPAGAKVFFACRGLDSYGVLDLSQGLKSWRGLRNGLAHGFRPDGAVSSSMPTKFPEFEDPKNFEIKYQNAKILGKAFALRGSEPKAGKWTVNADILVKTLADDALELLREEIKKCEATSDGKKSLKKAAKALSTPIRKL